MVSQSCPEWARGTAQLVWDRLGVVIWDKAACKVYCLSPYQALDTLDEFRESCAWKDNPFLLHWSSYSMPFSEEDRRAWRSTKNRRNHSDVGEAESSCMILAPNQTQELFLFLERHEDEIHALGDASARETKKTLGRVYTFLINLGRKRIRQNERSD